MLKRRIIPCLDVKDGKVVKGVKFANHEIVGDIVELAALYRDQGADELVFYDITASAENRRVSKDWVARTASLLDIPFCVAGGIRTVQDAEEILNQGADKISINSPAVENPALITEIARTFGNQCVVVGVDSIWLDGDYRVCIFTGSEKTLKKTELKTRDWVRRARDLGAGEIVLNCMDQDGVRKGYDLKQLKEMRAVLDIPLVASGGAGTREHFKEVFEQARVDGALAASVFHKRVLDISELKSWLISEGIAIRPREVL